MRCPSCQHVENRASAMFCPHCGSLLRPVDKRAYLVSNQWIRWKDGTVTFLSADGRSCRHPARPAGSILRRLLRRAFHH